MRSSVSSKHILLLLSLAQHVVSSPRQGDQVVLAPPPNEDTASPSYADAHGDHVVDDTILAALNTHSDPVDALVSIQPDLAAELAEPRLIHVFGEPKPAWMTEGDKLRLRREHKKFMDITDHQELYTEQVTSMAGKASEITPITHVTCPGNHLVANCTMFQTYPKSPIKAWSSAFSPSSQLSACTTSLSI